MPNPNIEKRANEMNKHIELLEDWWKKTNDDDDYIVVQLISAHYLIVAAYGIIESEMKALVNRYVTKNSAADVAGAVKEMLAKRYSWDYQKIKSTLAEFNGEWSEQVKQRLDDRHIVSINSLKKTRGAIAHGTSTDANFEDAKKQFKNSIEGLHIISGIVEPEPHQGYWSYSHNFRLYPYLSGHNSASIAVT